MFVGLIWRDAYEPRQRLTNLDPCLLSRGASKARERSRRRHRAQQSGITDPRPRFLLDERREMHRSSDELTMDPITDEGRNWCEQATY